MLKFSCAKRLRVDYSCDMIPKAQILLVLNLPVFMFVYIHFNVPPTKITDLVINVSDEKIWNSHVCLCFCFNNLVCKERKIIRTSASLRFEI